MSGGGLARRAGPYALDGEPGQVLEEPLVQNPARYQITIRTRIIGYRRYHPKKLVRFAYKYLKL